MYDNEVMQPSFGSFGLQPQASSYFALLWV